MKQKIIAALTAFVMFAAAFAVFPASYEAIDVKKVHAPGGEVSNLKEFCEALGGEEAILSDSLCLKTDIILDSPLVICEGDYVLSGAGCVVTKGFAEGNMVVIKAGASLCLGDEKHVGDYADIILSGNMISRSEDDGTYVRETEEPFFESEKADGSMISVEGGTFSLLSGAVLQNGYSKKDGAGIRLESGTVFLNGGKIQGFGTEGNGGGVMISAGSTFRMLSGSISDCYASGQGGGVFSEGKAELTGGEVTGSAAKQGGGLYAADAVTFTDFSFSENRAEQGGGIYFAAEMIVSGCTVLKNTAEQGGGAYNSSVLDIKGMSSYANSAADGAGMYNAGTMTITGCYFSENVASNQGGGIFNSTEGVFSWSGGTLASNSAEAGGGIMNCGEMSQDGGAYLVNKAAAGSALCNLGYLTFSGSVCISDIATVMLVPGAGKNQGIIQVDGKLTAETAAVIIPGKTENGTFSVDYDNTMPFLAGSAEDVSDAAPKIKVKALGDQKYALKSDGTLKKVYDLPDSYLIWILIGVGAILVAGFVSWFLIRKKKKADAVFHQK